MVFAAELVDPESRVVAGVDGVGAAVELDVGADVDVDVDVGNAGGLGIDAVVGAAVEFDEGEIVGLVAVGAVGAIV